MVAIYCNCTECGSYSRFYWPSGKPEPPKLCWRCIGRRNAILAERKLERLREDMRGRLSLVAGDGEISLIDLGTGAISVVVR